MNYPPISFRSAAPRKQACTHDWQFSEAQSDRLAFKILQVKEFITELCTQQAEAIQNHKSINICNIGQGEAQHTKYKRLKLAAVNVRSSI